MATIIDQYKIAFTATTSGLEKGISAATGNLNKMDYAATKSLQAIQKQIIEFNHGKAAAEEFSLKLKGVSKEIIDQTVNTINQFEAMKNATAAAEREAQAQAKVQAEITATNNAAKQLAASLQHNINTYHMSEAEAEQYTLALQGVNRATRDEIAANRQALITLQQATKAQNELAAATDRAERELKQEADQWRRLTQTPIEKHRDQLASLNRQRISGGISERTYGRGRSMIDAELKAAQDAANKAAGGMGLSFNGLLTTMAKVGGAIYALKFAFDTLSPLISVPVKLAAEFEKTHVAMSTLLGDSQLATGLLSQWEELAAKSPFNSTDINQAGKTLLAMGYSVGEVTESLYQLTDIAAGSGANLSHLAVIFGQGSATGKWLGADLRQLANQGIPAVQELQKVLGVDSPAAVYKLVEAGEVMDSHMRQVMKNMTSAGGLYFEATKAQSETLIGLWEQLGDQISLSLKAVGEEMIRAWDFKATTQSMIDFAESIRKEYIPVITTVITMARQVYDFWAGWVTWINATKDSLGEYAAWADFAWKAFKRLVSPLNEVWELMKLIVGPWFADEYEKQQAAMAAAAGNKATAEAKVAAEQEKNRLATVAATAAIDAETEAVKRYADISKKAFEDVNPMVKYQNQLEELEDTYSANRATAANPNGMTKDTYDKKRQQILNESMGWTDPREAFNNTRNNLQSQFDSGKISQDEYDLGMGKANSDFFGVDFDSQALEIKIGMQKVTSAWMTGIITTEEMMRQRSEMMPDLMTKGIEGALTKEQLFAKKWAEFSGKYKGLYSDAEMKLAQQQMYKDVVGDESKDKKNKKAEFGNFAIAGSAEAHQAALRNQYGIPTANPQKDMVTQQKKANEKLDKLNQNIESAISKGYQSIF